MIGSADGHSRLRIKEIPSLRAMVEEKLREGIVSGVFKPGQRLVERELCEMIGVSRPSIREALRLRQSLREIAEIARAIDAGDVRRAERSCVDHVHSAAKVALEVLRQSQRGTESKKGKRS